MLNLCCILAFAAAPLAATMVMDPGLSLPYIEALPLTEGPTSIGLDILAAHKPSKEPLRCSFPARVGGPAPSLTAALFCDVLEDCFQAFHKTKVVFDSPELMELSSQQISKLIYRSYMYHGGILKMSYTSDGRTVRFEVPRDLPITPGEYRAMRAHRAHLAERLARLKRRCEAWLQRLEGGGLGAPAAQAHRARLAALPAAGTVAELEAAVAQAERVLQKLLSCSGLLAQQRARGVA